MSSIAVLWGVKDWSLGCLTASSLDASDELRAATYIVRRTTLQIWQVSDSITISTNTHPIRTLTWAVPTSWADAGNGPLARVNICGIVSLVWQNFQLLILRQNQRSYVKRCRIRRSDSWLILRSGFLKWTKELRAKKVASPDSETRFSILMLKIYLRESLSVTKSLHRRIRNRIRKNQELELCQMRPKILASPRQ
jgi:hypothetical protein